MARLSGLLGEYCEEQFARLREVPMTGQRERETALSLINWACGLDPGPCFVRYTFVHQQSRSMLTVANQDGVNLLGTLLGRIHTVWKAYPNVRNPSPVTALYNSVSNSTDIRDFRDNFSQLWFGGNSHEAPPGEFDAGAEGGWSDEVSNGWRYRSQPFARISGQGPTTLPKASEIYERALGGDTMMAVFAAPARAVKMGALEMGTCGVETDEGTATVGDIVVLDVGWNTEVCEEKRSRIWRAAICELAFL